MIDWNFEDVEEFDFNQKDYEIWIESIVKEYKKDVGELTYIFCSDDYLLEMNRSHLDHDYYTDIITFDYCEGNLISGDLFISLDRVEDNARELGVSFKEEFSRVVIHGVLHLCGFLDKSEEESKKMREAENDALKKLCFT